MSKVAKKNCKDNQEVKRRSSNNATLEESDGGKRKVQVDTKEVSAKKFKELQSVKVIVEHW